VCLEHALLLTLSRREKMRRINSERPLTEIERNKRFYDSHRESELERNRQYHQNNKEKIAKRRRNTRHGITQEWFDEKRQEQENRCAICNQEFTETPHIDHKHSCCPKLRSCEVCRRSLLCASCNILVGMARESTQILSSAIQYLEKWSKQ
jgi:hypothetical protein